MPRPSVSIASLATVLSGTVAACYLVSFLYVCGASWAVAQNVQAFFTIKDYLDITPGWAILAFCPVLIANYLVWSGCPVDLDKPPATTHPEPSKTHIGGWRKRTHAFAFTAPFALGYAIVFIASKTTPIYAVAGPLCAAAVVHGITRNPTLSLVRKLGLNPFSIPWIQTTAITMAFSFSLGQFWYPLQLSFAGTVEVPTKSSATPIQGKLLFSLERFVLIQTQDGSIIAVPPSEVQQLRTEPYPRRSRTNPSSKSPSGP